MVNLRRFGAQHRKADQNHDQSTCYLKGWSADSKEAEQIIAKPSGEKQGNHHGESAAACDRPVLTLVAVCE